MRVTVKPDVQSEGPSQGQTSFLTLCEGANRGACLARTPLFRGEPRTQPFPLTGRVATLLAAEALTVL